MHIQICSMLIQNTPGIISARLFCSYWLIQGEVDLIGCFPAWPFFLVKQHHRGAKCCSMLILNSGVALMRIQSMEGAALFYHISA